MLDPSREIHEVDIDLLQPSPLQPRGTITPESLVELVDSIREQGILEPLVVAKTPAGYQIVAGERRWRAAKIAGLSTVPIIIKKATPKGMLEMSLVENVQREDLNPLERARGFQRLKTEFRMGTSEIAEKIGKSQSYVSNSFRLLTLPDILKDGLLLGQTTEGHVRALATLEDPKLIVEAYKKVLKENLSVRGAEEIARRLKAQVGSLGLNRRTRQVIKRPSKLLDKIRDDLTEKFRYLGCKPKVNVTQSRIQARVTMLLGGNMETTDKALRYLYKSLVGTKLVE
jgi:ParB family chromosome partitioning protein